MSMEINELTGQIIGAAIAVHKALGPGLLESAYEECLCHELSLRQIHFGRQRLFLRGLFCAAANLGVLDCRRLYCSWHEQDGIAVERRRT